MAIIVKVKKKEQINELLGKMLAWGAIAFLIGKLLGFKFNLQSDDQMTKWGVQLGDAFKFSRQKLKRSGMDPAAQDQVDRILSAAEGRIKNLVQEEERKLRIDPTYVTTADTQIQDICDDAVNRISRIVKDRAVAEDYVVPLRKTFASLTGSLDSVRKEAALTALRADPTLEGALRSAFTTTGRSPSDVDVLVRSALDSIASGIASRMS